jgi:hypothetical protein
LAKLQHRVGWWSFRAVNWGLSNFGSSYSGYFLGKKMGVFDSRPFRIFSPLHLAYHTSLATGASNWVFGVGKAKPFFIVLGCRNIFKKKKPELAVLYKKFK